MTARWRPGFGLGVAIGLVLAIVIALGLAACSGTDGPRETATGIVVDVDATGLDRVESFTIRTAEGDMRSFGIAALDPGSFPPGHLTEHAATGQPIIVTYVVGDDGVAAAVRLEDAPAGPSATS